MNHKCLSSVFKAAKTEHGEVRFNSGLNEMTRDRRNTTPHPTKYLNSPSNKKDRPSSNHRASETPDFNDAWNWAGDDFWNGCRFWDGRVQCDWGMAQPPPPPAGYWQLAWAAATTECQRLTLRSSAADWFKMDWISLSYLIIFPAGIIYI